MASTSVTTTSWSSRRAGTSRPTARTPMASTRSTTRSIANASTTIGTTGDGIARHRPLRHRQHRLAGRLRSQPRATTPTASTPPMRRTRRPRTRSPCYTATASRLTEQVPMACASAISPSSTSPTEPPSRRRAIDAHALFAYDDTTIVNAGTLTTNESGAYGISLNGVRNYRHHIGRHRPSRR